MRSRIALACAIAFSLLQKPAAGQEDKAELPRAEDDFAAESLLVPM